MHRAERASKCSANFAVSLIFLSLLISFSPVGLRQFINGSLSLSLSLRWSILVFPDGNQFRTSLLLLLQLLLNIHRDDVIRHTVVTAISGWLNFIQLNLWELSMSCAGNKSLVLSCNDFSDMNSTQWLFGAHYKCSYLNMADDYIQNLLQAQTKPQ